MIELFKYLKPHRLHFASTGVASVTNKILDLMPPLLIAWVIDTVRREPPPWIDAVLTTDDPLMQAAFLAGLGVGIFALESIFQYLYQYGFFTLAQKIQHLLRMDAYNKIQSREYEFFENHRMGETMAILNDDVNQLESFLNHGFNDLLQLTVLMIFCTVVFLDASWELMLVGVLPIPLILWGSLIYQRIIAPRYTRVRESVGALNSRLENNIAGIMVIKAFTAEKFESERVESASREYRDANFGQIRVSALYIPLIRMIVAIGFGGVLLLGGYQVLKGDGTLSVGELALFTMMIQRLLWPLTRLGKTLNDFERARASARRVFGLLNAPVKIKDPVTPRLPAQTRGEIHFDKVNFHYDNGLAVLRELDFKIGARETIGIAGATGAGKSSLIKLMLRLYDPIQGEIRLDGIGLQDYELQELRRRIALVSQDVYLFHGTIGENIAYGSQGAELHAIQEAARLSHLHDFVQTLPEGYGTIVGERGLKLSGGQRQRLSIARALMKDAPILIFDEATSSVDTETERDIQQNLASITRGKTALIIAHRLSTIRHADRILVMSQGKIVEEGRHEELIAKAGVYADLWHVQAGDEISG